MRAPLPFQPGAFDDANHVTQLPGAVGVQERRAVVQPVQSDRLGRHLQFFHIRADIQDQRRPFAPVVQVSSAVRFSISTEPGRTAARRLSIGVSCVWVIAVIF